MSFFVEGKGLKKNCLNCKAVKDSRLFTGYCVRVPEVIFDLCKYRHVLPSPSFLEEGGLSVEFPAIITLHSFHPLPPPPPSNTTKTGLCRVQIRSMILHFHFCKVTKDLQGVLEDPSIFQNLLES